MPKLVCYDERVRSQNACRLLLCASLTSCGGEDTSEASSTGAGGSFSEGDVTTCSATCELEKQLGCNSESLDCDSGCEQQLTMLGECADEFVGLGACALKYADSCLVPEECKEAESRYLLCQAG